MDEGFSREKIERPAGAYKNTTRSRVRPSKPAYDPERPPTPEQAARLSKTAWNSALWHLNRSDKSVKEIRDKLEAKKELPPEIIEDTLNKLIEIGFLNDARYAKNKASSLAENRKLGIQRIKQELYIKGIDRDIIDQIAAESDEENEAEAAYDLVERKLRTVENLDRNKATQRLVGFLARRGYSASLAYSIVKELLDAEGAEKEKIIREGEFLEE